MPHILLRFMAIGDKDKLKTSRRIATVWVFISMAIAILIGVIGSAAVKNGTIALDNANSQRIIIEIAKLISDNSAILAVVAGAVAPVFAPLGFGDWRVVTALVAGFMAKESVVSTLTVLFGSTAMLQAALSPAVAMSLLIFCLLYTPCVAAVASVKQELGGKWAVGVAFGQCAVAWICAFAAKLIFMMII
jgi:Fe2+ transport system protein B